MLPVVLVSVAGLLKGAPAALLAPRTWPGTVTGAAAAVVWAAAGMAVTSGRTLIGEGAPDIGSARSATREISSSGTARTAMDLVCEYVPSGTVDQGAADDPEAGDLGVPTDDEDDGRGRGQPPARRRGATWLQHPPVGAARRS